MNKNKVLVAPSVLAADFNKLGAEIEMLNGSEAEWIHFDVMDGVFVPNISIGFPVLEAINKIKQKPLDVHLMIINPENYVNEFARRGADHITVHIEACNHLHRVIYQIKNAGCKAGVALNPHIGIDSLSEIIEDVDIVNIMSVNPGFSGQQFIINTYKKLQQLAAMIKQSENQPYVMIDGGVNLENAGKLSAYGANILVAGSTVFKSEDPYKTIKALKNT